MIRRFIAVLGLLALPLAAARAELKFDTLKVGAAVYTNVTVIDVTATDLYFRHQGGVGNTKLRYLEPEIQKRFHYDPDVAADAERQRDDESAHYVPNQSSAAYTGSAGGPVADSGPAATEDIPRLADPVGDSSPIDKPAPPVSVEKWLTDKPVTTDKSVLVFFWKPQSAPCRRAINDLNGLQKRFPDTLAVIAITTESERDISQMADPHIDFASGIDTQGTMLRAAGVNSLPGVLLIDAKGIIRYAGHPAGLKDDALDKILAKP
jgi:thiol-disulfide isomerase/thioredoxin